MRNDIEERLKELSIEEFIWIIYIGIIILSFYSNRVEKKALLYNDICAKGKYRRTLIFIFSILIIVYFYFFKDSLDTVKSLDSTCSSKKVLLSNLSLIASTLILISGFIFLYIAYSDKDIDVEIAFN